MVFATTTRDLTVSAANRPWTAVQVEVCVIRTHHRRHQTVDFPYRIATNCNLFTLFNSVSLLKNQHYSPKAKRFAKRNDPTIFSFLVSKRSWAEKRAEKLENFEKNEKNWKSRIDFFLCRVLYRSNGGEKRAEKFENFKKTKKIEGIGRIWEKFVR